MDQLFNLDNKSMDIARAEFSSGQTVLWQEGSDAILKCEYIHDFSLRDGFCYMSSLFYCCDLARLPLLEFRKAVDDFAEVLKVEPLGGSVILQLFAYQNQLLSEIGQADLEVPQRIVHGDMESAKMENVLKRMDLSGIRLNVEQRNGKLHVVSNRRPWCDCGEVICQHGWSFRMARVVFVSSGKCVGASGFNLSDFLSDGLNTEDNEEFEDSFSIVSPESQNKSANNVREWQEKAKGGRLDPNEIRAAAYNYVVRQDLKNGTNEASKIIPPAPPMPQPRRHSKPHAKIFRMETLREEPSTQPTIPANGAEVQPEAPSNCELTKSMSEILGLVKRMNNQAHLTSERMETLESLVKVKQPVTPPPSPEQSLPAQQRVQSEIGFNDSSSCVDRYENRYMDHGTVLTLRRSQTAADAEDQRTILTANNFLVEGFQKTEEIVRMEKVSQDKLRPITGLPRPFRSARFNFLANIHTAIQRSLSKGDGKYLNSLLKSMNGPTILASDNLLNQVLNTTIDKQSGVFCGNFFNLPYLEIGMPLTEDSLMKVFTLLKEEYKMLYFQEMKDILIPDFHSMFGNSSEEVLVERRVKRDRETRRSESQATHGPSARRQRSLLGF